MDDLDSADPTLMGTQSMGTTPGAAAAEPVPGRGAVIGRYLVLDPLGRGANGTVLGAYDADLDRRVALKLLAKPLDADETRRQLLLTEAQAMAKIHHRNVAAVYDVGVWHDRLYVAMEYVAGPTLARWLSLRPRTPAEILAIHLDAAAGLEAAHEAGVVHRDFKPANVLVAPGERAVVVDFGLAMPQPGADARADDTAGFAVAGTPAYMAPEQFAGAVIDGRSDQFAFCVSLFEALAGARPFAGNSLAMLAANVSRAVVDPTAAARLPPRLRPVILRGLAREPERRYPSMMALVQALRAAGRSTWTRRVWVAAGLGLAAAGIWGATRSPAPGVACEAGEAIVAGFWGDDARAAVRVVAPGASSSWLSSRRATLTRAVDAYLGAWALAHDEACAAMTTDEPARARARGLCLDNRLAAGRGMAEFVASREIASTTVDNLVVALPSVEECRQQDLRRWTFAPTDPELAAGVVELRARLDAIELDRVAAGRAADLGPYDALREEARALGFRPLVAEVALGHANALRSFDRWAEAQDELDDVISLAIEYDDLGLAATAVSRRLLFLQDLAAPRRDEAARWFRLAAAMHARSGAAVSERAVLANNYCVVLRQAGAAAEALEQCLAAEALYAEADAEPDAGRGYRRELLAARLNRAGCYIELGRYAEAEALSQEMVAAYDLEFGRAHPRSIVAVTHLAAVSLQSGRRHEAIARLDDAIARYGEAGMLRRATAGDQLLNLAVVKASVGDLMGARATYEQTIEIEGIAPWMRIGAQAAIAVNTGDDAAALAASNTALMELESDAPLASSIHMQRVALLLARGDDAEAQRELDSFCRTVEPSAYATFCRAQAVMVAAFRRDAVATATWLAWLDSRLDADDEERVMRAMAHAAVLGCVEPSLRVALELRRPQLVAESHPLHPTVRMLDRTLRVLSPTSGYCDVGPPTK